MHETLNLFNCYRLFQAQAVEQAFGFKHCAGGQFQVTEVYDWLARLSDLRRAVEQGHKASQRLSAMSDLAPTPTNATEVPPFRETVPAEPPSSKPDAEVDNPL